jgi:hypothetical protein
MVAESELEAFFEALMQDVVADATASGDLTRTAFVESCARRLLEAEALQDWTPAYYDGRGHRRRAIGLDGYSDDELELDGTLHVLAADVREVGLETLKSTDVRDAFSRACAFIEDAHAGKLDDVIEPSTPAADLARLIAGNSGLRTLKVHVLSNAAIGARFRDVQRSAIGSIQVELHVWDLGRFHDLAAQGGREELDINLAEFVPGGLMALPAGIGEAGYSSYLAAVPGVLLADIYQRYGSRLLEGNVRAFLSVKGKVNKGIRLTILKQPEMFFAFNNGITATATSAEVERTNGSCLIRRVRDLQIVNGGQTTASLFNARARDDASLDGVFVQMKLSVMAADAAETMIPEISRYANTQNKVSDADLFANHPFHRALEDISRRIWAPARPGSQQMTHWFYERARAQYQSELVKLKQSEKNRFKLQNPESQKIEKTDVALYENTWKQLPHIVSLGAQKNFVAYAEQVAKDYDERPEDFNERWFQYLVAKAIVFDATEHLVSSASWYTGGYRRNIVTYAIARFLRLVNEKFRGHVLDLDRIWRSQRVSDAVCQQMSQAAEVAFSVVANPPAPWTNVTEWAKKPACWERVAATPVVVVQELRSELKPLDEEKTDLRDARGQAVEDEAIGAVVKAMQLGSQGVWSRALSWQPARRVLTATEYGILTTAASRRNFVPTDAQAQRLVAAYDRLRKEGFD